MTAPILAIPLKELLLKPNIKYWPHVILTEHVTKLNIQTQRVPGLSSSSLLLLVSPLPSLSYSSPSFLISLLSSLSSLYYYHYITFICYHYHHILFSLLLSLLLFFVIFIVIVIAIINVIIFILITNIIFILPLSLLRFSSSLWPSENGRLHHRQKLYPKFIVSLQRSHGLAFGDVYRSMTISTIIWFT